MIHMEYTLLQYHFRRWNIPKLHLSGLARYSDSFIYYSMKIFLLKMFSNIDNANLLIILSHEYIIV